VLDSFVSAAKAKGLPGEEFLKDIQDSVAKRVAPAGETGK
jgi:hypothetical protein